MRAQSCPALCNPMDCGPPGFSVHGIFQAIICRRLLFPTLGDLFHPGIEPASPALTGGFFTTEPPGKPKLSTLIYEIPIIGKFKETESIMEATSGHR